MTEFIATYWLGFLFAGVTGVLGFICRWIFTQFKALKFGVQAILRDRIIDQYNKYMDKEFIPIYAMENVTAMYKEYHALGGNGTITELYKQLLELSHRKEV
jgi:hypothetical protein